MNCLALLYVLELMGWFMVFNTNFNNTTVKLWLSDLLMEETGIPRENHRPVKTLIILTIK
jgi:hypothetical protein